MRILVYSDPHWCEYSSIVRKRGDKYSLRLENLIKSINWVEDLSKEKNCNVSICCGDFFDKSELNASEITALKEINWNRAIPHYTIIGNHEMGSSDLSISSSHLFSYLNCEFNVVDRPFIDDFGDVELAFIPYVLEADRKPIEEYISYPPTKKRILFTHNDIKGIQMGKFISQAGFDIKEIENICSLCFNGHLHNGEKVSSKILNVGNLTGQNFSEDASKYRHGAYIIDTDTLDYEFIENPYAFNFWKIDHSVSVDDFGEPVVQSSLAKLDKNIVCTIKTTNPEYERDAISRLCNNVVEYRLIIANNISKEVTIQEEFSVDHIKQFNDYILANLENTEILLQELAEVCQ